MDENNEFLFVARWRASDMKTNGIVSYPFIRSWIVLTVKYLIMMAVCLTTLGVLLIGIPLLLSHTMGFDKDIIAETLLVWWIGLCIIILAALAAWREVRSRQIEDILRRNGDL